MGAPPLAGGSAYTNGTFTIKGCGADIWSTSDQFQFAYVYDTGDFTITARVARKPANTSMKRRPS